MRHDDPSGSAQEIQALQLGPRSYTEPWSQVDGSARTSEIRSSFSLVRAFFAGVIFLEWVSGIHASSFSSPRSVRFFGSSCQTQYVIMTFPLAVLSLAGRFRPPSVRRAKLSGTSDARRIADPTSEATKLFGSGSRIAGSDVGSDGFSRMCLELKIR
ncbi:hypothetical protein ISCGN_011521 [Ixodes scapularis]